MESAAGYLDKEDCYKNAYDHVILFTWKDMTDDSPDQEKIWQKILQDSTPSFN